MHHEAFGRIGTFGDFKWPWTVALSNRPGIAAIREDFFDEGEAGCEPVQNKSCAVPVLYAC